MKLESIGWRLIEKTWLRVMVGGGGLLATRPAAYVGGSDSTGVWYRRRTRNQETS